MKELMIGNAAVARGLYEAGVQVVSSYPGTPSTKLQNLQQLMMIFTVSGLLMKK